MVVYCGTCDKELSRIQHSIEAIGHTFGDWTVITDSTCTEKGQERRDCEHCDHYETREIALLDHVYLDSLDPSCEICGEIREISVETIAILRLYNPVTGEHHYTGSAQERDVLVEAGWIYEGIAWYALPN